MIEWIQEYPLHPWAEIEGEINLKEILDFLLRSDLPDDMSFGVDGALYHFKTPFERYQWATGFRHGYRIGKDSAK